jgi:hypothetical protein
MHRRWLRSTSIVASLGVALTAQDRPPQIPQVYLDSVRPGGEAIFKVIEEDAARICAEMQCPNAHMALESLTSPKEVWWLTPYDSGAERERVAAAYAANPELVAALQGIDERKKAVTGMPVNLFVNHRQDESGSVRWQFAGARYVVVTVTKQVRSVEGVMFMAADGTRFIFRMAGTLEQAKGMVTAPDARIFAIRPYWGMPAKEWIAADPDFWATNPMAARRYDK